MTTSAVTSASTRRRRPRRRRIARLAVATASATAAALIIRASEAPPSFFLARAEDGVEVDYHHGDEAEGYEDEEYNAERGEYGDSSDDDGDDDGDEEEEEDVDYGNHNLEWEDGPSSWEEFGHDNDPDVCGLQFLTVAEWEEGRFWEGDVPVIVKNVTGEWPALVNWKKQEMVRRYPDAEATMGEARLVGETGPDEAGKNLEPTTVKEFITKHMYNPVKYFFDRKIAIPKGMLTDCHPFPMPTRAFLANPEKGEKYAPSKKARVRTTPDRELWRDHLAVSIGSDLQGLTFHHHREAWNAVIFGKKRWILWDFNRWKDDNELQWRVTRDWANNAHVTGADWIRRLYPEPDRKAEIREHGHDCIQHAGDMMFVPHRWMHMVVNIGDTVSVISEVGLGAGEGKKPEDFEYDPKVLESREEESEDEEDSEDWDSEDYWDRDSQDEWDSEDEDYDEEFYDRRGPPPPGWVYSEH